MTLHLTLDVSVALLMIRLSPLRRPFPPRPRNELEPLGWLLLGIAALFYCWGSFALAGKPGAGTAAMGTALAHLRLLGLLVIATQGLTAIFYFGTVFDHASGMGDPSARRGQSFAIVYGAMFTGIGVAVWLGAVSRGLWGMHPARAPLVLLGVVAIVQSVLLPPVVAEVFKARMFGLVGETGTRVVMFGAGIALLYAGLFAPDAFSRGGP